MIVIRFGLSFAFAVFLPLPFLSEDFMELLSVCIVGGSEYCESVQAWTRGGVCVSKSPSLQ